MYHPSHPSLPRRPVAGPQTQPITPYGCAYPDPNTYSSHYAQAYYPQIAPQSAPSGFNFSSAATDGTNKIKGTPVHLMSTWYRSGNTRCSYPACAFQGSQKSVELHRMDRHLIYPPGWDKRKNKSEWDADPSLKGYNCPFAFVWGGELIKYHRKLIPIQGTNVTLNTPELIGAWIAERKKRFPTSTRVEDKKRKLAEALERGQLDLDPSRSARLPKRRKASPDGQRLQIHGSRGTAVSRNVKNRRKRRQGQANIAPIASPEKGDKESDDDEAAPEERSSKIPDLDESAHGDEAISISPPTSHQPQEQKRLKGLQPRGPPKNPFASRPALLRNVSPFPCQMSCRLN